MSNQIYWTLICDVNNGQLDALKTVSKKFCELTAQEEGVVAYEWSLSSDTGVLHVHERYVDSDAALAHLGNVGPHLDELFALVAPREIICYGNASDAFRDAVRDFPMTYMDMFNGFNR